MHLHRRDAARALATAAPWLWFAVRDLSVVMEVVAVLLPALVATGVVGLAALAVRRPRRWLLAPAASLAIVGVVSVVGPWLPRATGAPVDATTIAVANVLSSNRSTAAVVGDILGQDADVVVVPEAPLAVHERLAAAYPHEVRADRRDDALGVYSRLPLADSGFVPGLLPRTRQVRVEVDGRFVLWAVHLPRPWPVAGGNDMRPGGHARKLDELLDAFAAESLPVVVAGDTNLTDRGRGYRRMTARFDDALRVVRGGPTSTKRLLRPLLLRIDHVFVPDDWCADDGGRFDLTGSDHRGVRVRVGPCGVSR